MKPDLVIANKEENRREDVDALRSAGLEVVVTDPNSVEEALTMIADLGERFGCRDRAASLISDVRSAVDEPVPFPALATFVAVWKEPLMGLGGATYGSDVLRCAGMDNVMAGRSRYPEISREELANLGPRLILLPDEPYPFTAGDADAFGERRACAGYRWQAAVVVRPAHAGGDP